MSKCTRKKIVLIGPVYPYKGGIAHYTSLMFQSLAKKHDVTMISYKMQYPKLLYKREQKDYSNDIFKVEETKFWINTANPFNIIRIAQKIKRMAPDLIIIQWWHPYFAPCYLLLVNVLGKKLQKLFVCHNVFPHERFPMDKFLTRLVMRKGDYFIVHSKNDGQDLLSIKENAKFMQNPHPTYNAFKIRNITKEHAKQELHKIDDEKLLLFFGFVREYKGLKYLLYAMPMIKEKIANIKLMVVGSFGDDKDEYKQIIKDNQIEDCVEIMDNYVPDNEVEKYFAACDVVVLPYESATQSGIVQIAYGFEKPVIVTNVGGLPDVVMDGKTGYVVEAKNSMALAEAVKKYFLQNKEEEFVDNVRNEAYRFDWERMVEKIEMFL